MAQTTATRSHSISLEHLLDEHVRDTQGRDIGRVEDLILDASSGTIDFALVKFGGVLGMGTKYHLIPWPMLAVDTERRTFRMNVTKEQVDRAPSFDRKHVPTTDDRQYLDSVFQYWGIDRSQQHQRMADVQYGEQRASIGGEQQGTYQAGQSSQQQSYASQQGYGGTRQEDYSQQPQGYSAQQGYSQPQSETYAQQQEYQPQSETYTQQPQGYSGQETYGQTSQPQSQDSEQDYRSDEYGSQESHAEQTGLTGSSEQQPTYGGAGESYGGSQSGASYGQSGYGSSQRQGEVSYGGGQYGPERRAGNVHGGWGGMERRAGW